MSGYKARYKITPQMKEYDRIGTEWLPYLMYFHTKNFSSSVLNTDSRGFRLTYKNENKIDVFSKSNNAPVSLLVGGSFAFGVGATGDRKTIASILNSSGEETWFNFAGRAFSSTQEFLAFLFYYKKIKRIKKVVLLSGINNLILYYLSGKYNKELGSFFFSSKYDKVMTDAMTSRKRKLFNALISPFVKKPKLSVFAEEKEASRDDVFVVLKRDIESWKLICESLGIEFTYVLQPFASWIDKKLSEEEKELFAELDKKSQSHWKVLRYGMGSEKYGWYRDGISNICNASGVKFFDMNEAISKMKLDGKWLYVDRAHFTDEGNRIVAEIFKKEIL